MDHHFVTGQGPWTLYPVEIDERPDEETRQGTLLGLMLQQEEVKMKMGNRCPCLLMGVGRASPLNGGGGRGWVGLAGSAHLLGGAVGRDRAQDPAFAPRTSEVAAGL